jgi:hypothetical protein
MCVGVLLKIQSNQKQQLVLSLDVYVVNVW